MKLNTSYADLQEYGDKYHFYYNDSNNTVVCTTLYKGQMVRGIAKCSPEDNFSLGAGKKLAYLRCKEKFLRKKLKRAFNAKQDAVIAEARANNNLRKAYEFVADSQMQLEAVEAELAAVEACLN